ncbi:hypothetical protein HNQ91_000413 [Filimonas zeae]|uniref:Uncharacterized protein n=1 Tax=Filimonas zeae TaxID=1737353 RepID=A0A917ILX2_9BACT|nr:hypothetical protein [Filimonas zeae]MDR6337391.1 hypothetical protein [Filimonas zeae]GGH58384.1 hypothetical protein GCM10011379_04060 [Filimonas zeae]
MARQSNIFKLKGTIGDATFYKTQDGYMIREKGGIEGDRIKTDPRFQRTRENMTEFGYSGRMGKMIRNAFKPMLNRSTDNRFTGRLVRNIMDVLKTDETSVRGKRNLLAGDVTLLQGLEFNARVPLSVVFTIPFSVAVDRVTGAVTAEITNFIPENQVLFPHGATHCKPVLAAATIDFATGAVNMTSNEGAPFTNGADEMPASSLSCNVSANTTLPVFVVLCAFFYQEVNGTLYMLRSGGFNAISLIKVDAIA